MSNLILKPKTLGGFVRALSGVFITKENPQGLTLTEINILVGIYSILLSKKKIVIDKEVKVELANLTNNKLQVIVNYINKLKRKNAITQDDKLHSIFYKQLITIEYGSNILQSSDSQGG